MILFNRSDDLAGVRRASPSPQTYAPEVTVVRTYDYPRSGTPVAFGPAEIAALRTRATPLRRRRWFILLLAAVVVLGSALSVVLVQTRSHSADHPSAWDPRVEPFVSIVERQRGLTFEHPIYVDFLSSQDFRDEIASHSAKGNSADTREILRTAGLLRPLGLVSGDPDLINDVDQLRGSGLIGLYSYADQRISLRGTELTPAIQSVLVRELTRALDDQSFDLGGRLADLSSDPTRRTALLTLAEGDAARVERAWRHTLTPEELESLQEDEARLGADSEGTALVPMALTMMAGVPVEFGAALLDVVAEGGGQRGIDSLFLTPPTTQEHLLDPWTLVQDHQGYLAVEEPRLEVGDNRLDGGTFGAISWLVVLAEQLPINQALAAAEGWGGDAYVAFEREGRECVRVDFAGDNPRDLAQMKVALREWVEATPAGSARVRRAGGRLELESCALESAFNANATGGSRGAVSLAVARSHLSVELVRTDLDIPVARCGAARLARVVPAEELQVLDLGARRVRRDLRACEGK